MGGDSPERGGIIGPDLLDVSPGNSSSLERIRLVHRAPVVALNLSVETKTPVNRICRRRAVKWDRPPADSWLPCARSSKASRPIRTPSHYEADGLPSRSKMALFGHTKLMVDQQDGPVP
jgi:hypothetical protein